MKVSKAARNPVSDFEQRAADISVDHPLVLENYRAATEARSFKQRDRRVPKNCAKA